MAHSNNGQGQCRDSGHQEVVVCEGREQQNFVIKCLSIRVFHRNLNPLDQWLMFNIRTTICFGGIFYSRQLSLLGKMNVRIAVIVLKERLQYFSGNNDMDQRGSRS